MELVRSVLDVRAVIQWGGIAGITAIIFVETGLFFGFFLPGDSLLVTAGILSAAGVLDIRLLLGLRSPPISLQVVPAIGIGDVLVVSPQAIEPAAQVVDQVVIVVFQSATLSEMFVFFFRGHRHVRFAFPTRA